MKLALWLLPLSALIATPPPPNSTPLPDPHELKQRALANMKKSEKDRENYSCIVRSHETEFNADGSEKRNRSRLEERFYVNGMEINHVLARDGKDLSGNDAKKEQERVDHQVMKYSDRQQVEKAKAQDEKEVDMFLRAQRFTNGRREIRDGRSTVVYDLTGDPGFHPKNIEERFANALTGRVWIDEDSGTPVEVQAETRRDIKMGAGLIATLHKGFQLHLVQQREPDGVWITKSVYGTGDARAALFFHPRFRFQEELDKCHLFSVDTKETVGQPGAVPPRDASPSQHGVSR